MTVGGCSAVWDPAIHVRGGGRGARRSRKLDLPLFVKRNIPVGRPTNLGFGLKNSGRGKGAHP